ncbi:MAG TPA: hypothetical protein VM012_09035 [Flavitalea sp.]|nr:hypothetical protein [Flavitalea sp.]
MTTNELRQKVRDKRVEASQQEEKNNSEAIRLYEECIGFEYPDPIPFQRLMILYRKEKKYKEELRVINSGIKIFTDDMEEQKKNNHASRNLKKINELSNAFMKSAGLNKKNSEIFYPEPIPTWLKRKALVEKKINSKSK